MPQISISRQLYRKMSRLSIINSGRNSSYWCSLLAAFALGFTICSLTSRIHQSPSESTAANWLDVDASSMSGQQMMDYLLWTNNTSCQLTQYFGGDHVVYVGIIPSIDGQKPVCMDVHVAPVVGQCVVYSFGVAGDWSFEEAMQTHKCQVFAFDPSIRTLDHQHSLNVFFFNMGLANADHDVGKNGWKMRTLGSIYRWLAKRHGHVLIDYLKIDIEGDEWEVIPQIIESGMLANVMQMGVEIHLDPANQTMEAYQRLVGIVQSLERNGMVRFDSKLNPWTERYIDAFGFKGYLCYEMAWYNSRIKSKIIEFD